MPSPDQALNHEHLVRHSSWGSVSVERHDELEKAHATMLNWGNINGSTTVVEGSVLLVQWLIQQTKDTASAIRDFHQINDFSDAFTGSNKVAESLPVYHVRPTWTEVREM